MRLLPDFVKTHFPAMKQIVLAVNKKIVQQKNCIILWVL
ncbi:hypothetical protein HSIEG1_2371 [Enterococcus sp. HSIEG1]|nr:hypothetical protein HSIEG1_2371 [Enterococcus sp. HSIEG1]